MNQQLFVQVMCSKGNPKPSLGLILPIQVSLGNGNHFGKRARLWPVYQNDYHSPMIPVSEK